MSLVPPPDDTMTSLFCKFGLFMRKETQLLHLNPPRRRTTNENLQGQVEASLNPLEAAALQSVQ